jgi:hypothetical protein
MLKPTVRGKNVRDEPIQVNSDDGNVAMTAPDGSVVVLSPDAAEETSDRLWKWAMAARREQRQRETADPPEDESPRPFMSWPESG